MIKSFLFLLSLLVATFSFSQGKPLDKIYIVEGMVADRETLEIISSAILYNNSLGITTTSDERGYFKIVVPLELIKHSETVNFEVIKTGYKRDGSGFSFNPAKPHTSQMRNDSAIVWHFGVTILLMAKNTSSVASTVAGQAPIEGSRHGFIGIKGAFNQYVASELKSRQLNKLKEGNENVYFIVNGKPALATHTTDIYLDNANTVVFLNDKKITLNEINKLVKRSKIEADWDKAEILQKQYKNDVLVLATIPKKTTPDTVWGSPEFKDGGKAIESLQLAYNCQSIEYENWENDDSTDNELTVCIINSPKVPKRDPDGSVKEFENIASQIKKALKYPERYRAYYIIFVKSETHSQPESSFKSHTAGMKVSAKGL